MTVRFRNSGRDPLLRAPQTQWQAERTRGQIQPMEQPRRRWFGLRRVG